MTIRTVGQLCKQKPKRTIISTVEQRRINYIRSKAQGWNLAQLSSKENIAEGLNNSPLAVLRNREEEGGWKGEPELL